MSCAKHREAECDACWPESAPVAPASYGEWEKRRYGTEPKYRFARAWRSICDAAAELKQIVKELLAPL